MSSNELFEVLLDSIKIDNFPVWWESYGKFDILVESILAQNTKWENVLKALSNLKNSSYMDLGSLANLDIKDLATLIKPSGFYNVKAKRLKSFLIAIKDEFENFENFKSGVDREWLIGINGIGDETCDSILCYGCEREVMVVDAYALKILSFLNYEFESYYEAKEWLSNIDIELISERLNIEKKFVYALYHGLIVEFCKQFSNKKDFFEDGKNILSRLK